MTKGKERKVFIKNGEPVGVIGGDGNRCRREGDALVVLRDERWGNPLFADASLDESDFHIHARITLDQLAGTGASMLLGGHYHYNWSRAQGNYSFRICFDQDIAPARKNKVNKDTYIVYGGTNPRKYWHSDEYMSEKQVFGSCRDYIQAGKPFDVDIFRQGNELTLEINKQKVFCIPFQEKTSPLTGRNGSNGYSMSVKLGNIISAGRSGDTGWPIGIGFLPDYGTIKIHDFYAEGCFASTVFPTSDVWKINTEGYGIYRIPSVCTTLGGRLLAFTEARRSFLSRGCEFHINDGREILSAELHCAMKSSDDGGQTWSEQTIIPQLEKGFTYEARDPSPLCDYDTGEIFLFTDGPNVISSRDDGHIWSEARSLSGSLPAGWKDIRTGTGNSAIQFRLGKYKGRLIVALYESKVVCLIFSDDHGKTWKPGAYHVADQNGEPSIAELSDGRLIVSPRHGNNKLGRLFLLSEDGGESFSEKRYEPALPMFGQGEIVAGEPIEIADKGKIRPIICCGPAENKTRLTVMVSLDDCKTWPISRVIDDGHAANLALVALPGGKVGVLYEAEKYHRLRFQRVDIAQVINDANIG